MTTAHVAPAPFDQEIDDMLADPEFVAELEAMRQQLDRGELTLHSDREARAVIERREHEHRQKGLGLE